MRHVHELCSCHVLTGDYWHLSNRPDLPVQIWSGMILGLILHMERAMGNDADLMGEIQSFWVEPALHIPLLSTGNINSIAIAVLQWLHVRPIFLSPASPFKLVPIGCFHCL